MLNVPWCRKETYRTSVNASSYIASRMLNLAKPNLGAWRDQEMGKFCEFQKRCVPDFQAKNLRKGRSERWIDLRIRIMCSLYSLPLGYAVDFTWSHWTFDTGCPVTCGEGENTQTRLCIEGSHGGKLCPTPSETLKTGSCNKEPCPGG